MMGGRFTLSKSDLAESCVYAFTKDAPDWPKIIKPIDSRINRAFHWICAKVINEPANASIIEQALEKHDLEPAKHRAKLLQMRAVEHATQFKERFSVTAQAEVALAYDWETGDVRVLGKDIGRDYILGPTEIGSTLDAFGADQDPDLGYTLEVGDWKTGPQAREHVTRCAANRQIGGLAMMLSRVIQVDAIRQKLWFVAGDGYLWTDEYIADPIEDTNETEAWLQDVVARIRRSEGPNPGPHCTTCYCPLFGACPATKETFRAVEQAAIVKKGEEPQPTLTEDGLLPAIVLDPTKFKSDAHAAWAIHRAQAAARLCEQIIDAGKAYVATRPGKRIALSNGKFYGAGTVKVPHVEIRGLTFAKEFAELVSSEIGEQEFAAMVMTKLSASDIREAVKTEPAYKKVIASLRKVGFVRDEEKEEYRERKGSAGALEEGKE